MSALRDNTIAFIGSGTMAEAMMKGILTRELITSEKITGSGPRIERGEKLAELYGIHATTDNASAAEAGSIVVLSVKPQVLPKVLTELRGHVRPDALVLSKGGCFAISCSSSVRPNPGASESSI